MKTYRKKPVEIQAVEWSGENVLEVLEFTGSKAMYDGAGRIKVHTLEGVMNANIGDYIIRGIKGEFYPCKPDIFKASYESVLG